MSETKQSSEDPSILLRSIEESLPIALLRAREAVMVRFRPHLAKYGLTEQKWRVIRSVAEAGEVEATQISADICILMPSLSRILKNLEADGLLQRIKDDDDGRRQRISMTDEGRKLFEEMSPKSADIYREIEADCGKSNIDELVKRLQSVRTALE